MKVQLGSGQEAHVTIAFEDVMVKRRVSPKQKEEPRRMSDHTHEDHGDGWVSDLRHSTVVKVQLPTGEIIDARAVCIPPDQFERRLGRFIAGRKLAEKLREKVPVEDRRRILSKIFT